jgi:zinc protease
MAKAFDKHPYNHTTLGFERDIEGMPKLYDYSRTFFSRYYRPDNTVLFIAGGVTLAQVLPLVEKYYGGWKRGYVPPQIPAEPEQNAERRVDVAYDGQTLPILRIEYKLPAFEPANRSLVATHLLAQLAFGETSETYRKLVLEEQVVDHLDASGTFHRDPYLLDIHTRIKDPAKVDYVLGVIDATIAQYRDAPPDSGIDSLYATYAAITPADVQAAAKAYLVPERRTVGVLRPRP